MRIEVACEHCGKQFSAPLESAGKHGKCPACQGAIRVPMVVVEPHDHAAPPRQEDWFAKELAAEQKREQERKLLKIQEKRQPVLPELEYEAPPETRKRDEDSLLVPILFVFLGPIAVAPISIGLSILMAKITAFSPTLQWAVGALFAFSAVVGFLIATFWIISALIEESITCLVMYFFVPFYAIYYYITRWDEMQRPYLFSLGLTPIFFAGFMMLGVSARGLEKSTKVAKSKPRFAAPAASRAPSPPHTTVVPPPASETTIDVQPIDTIPLPRFTPPRRGYEMEPGVTFIRAQLLSSARVPGSRGTLYIYLPSGRHEKHSLACLFAAPAGATSFTGMALSSADYSEHLPYVRAGYAVIAYEVDGPLASPEHATDAQFRTAYEQCYRAHAGLVNARNAIHYALTEIPIIDPERLATFGHSSAGRQALLLAANDPRIKACVAYAAPIDCELSTRDHIADMRQVLPQIDDYLTRFSPKNREDSIQCPVLLFHAHDDSIVPVQHSLAAKERFQSRRRRLTLELDERGGHGQLLLSKWTPRAIDWLQTYLGPGASLEPGVIADATAESWKSQVAGVATRPTAPASPRSPDIPRPAPSTPQPSSVATNPTPTRPTPAAPTNPRPSPQEMASFKSASRQYFHDCWLDVLASEPEQLVHRVRYQPGAERLTVGTRWGIGVYLDDKAVQPKIDTLNDLRPHLGSIGDRIAEHLRQGQEEGRYGAWMQTENSMLRDITFGGGTYAQFRQAASDLGLDAFVMATLSTKIAGLSRKTDVELRLRAVDVVTGEVVWTSQGMRSSKVAAARASGIDLADQFANYAAKELDKHFALEPPPNVDATEAHQRVDKWLDKKIQRQTLLEIRYFQAKGIWTDEEALAEATRVLGAERAAALVRGTDKQRRTAIDAWLAELEADGV
ncbi:MAG: prolyl oligopeptidase family serine peptidase [Planctomycetales bacterium]|nr:prolyl oligopeptidase family serine peptidase [Planctomycetales bacterium]